MADWRFTFLLAASGFINYYLALFIFGQKEGRRKSMAYYSGIIFNVGLLLYFKYFNFFIDGFTDLFNVFGAGLSFTPFHIILPLGISFFTFQMIGYLIDIKNEEIEPASDLLEFFTFLAYFPKILSGPIERVQRFVPQIHERRNFNYALAIDGLFQFVWGLFKKMVIADNCTPIVDSIFADYASLNGSTLLLGAFLISISVYADFSGYSDMACGVSKLFGINIINNFAFPFFSTNISTFWKKWHISLTSWMMDYLFTPLNFVLRGYGKLGLIFSIVITFLIVGLWHGANWTYIVYGILHGLFFVPLILKGSINTNVIVAKNRRLPSLREFFGMLGIFVLFSVSLVFLKAQTVAQAVSYISEIVSPSLFSIPKLVGIQNTSLIIVLLMTAPLIVLDWVYRNEDHVFTGLYRKRLMPQLILVACIVMVIFIFGGQQQAYIYFQF
ncbi:MAG: MBOAT family protein [Bacteroidales bacterium]|nr:MBOAT family protein [Bacteroidales bacterium]